MTATLPAAVRTPTASDFTNAQRLIDELIARRPHPYLTIAHLPDDELLGMVGAMYAIETAIVSTRPARD